MENYEVVTTFKFCFTDNACKGNFKDAVDISKAKIESTLNRMGKVFCVGYQASLNKGVGGSVFYPVHVVKLDYAVEKKQTVSGNDYKDAMQSAMINVDKDGKILKEDNRISGIKLRREIKKCIPDLV